MTFLTPCGIKNAHPFAIKNTDLSTSLESSSGEVVKLLTLGAKGFGVRA